MKTEKNFFTKTAAKLKDGQKRPRLAVTLGDPAGIGPEVILKALADPEVTQNCEITVIGSRVLLQRIDADLGHPHPQPLSHRGRGEKEDLGHPHPQPLSYRGRGEKEDLGHPHPQPLSHRGRGEKEENRESLVDLAGLSILDVALEGEIEGQITTGIGNAASGAASFAYLETAIARTLAGEFDAIVTGPIAKSAWKAAGHEYPGQTELLAEKAGVERFGMLFVARSPHTGWTLRTLLATTHIPLCQVSNALTPQLMRRKLDLLVECLQGDFGIEKPRIVVAGLNPHSGEMGQLGREEIDWLIPWLKEESDRRPNIILEGPIPPDTLWVKPGQAWFGINAENEKHPIPNPADGYLALYHDQGLIPVKLMAFDRAVNTTIGLPFIRTSPDHGTAFDIAGKGKADATSMKAALQLAVELVHQRSD